MEALKQKILTEGRVLPGNILKVDSFLNHQMDPLLMQQIGKTFASKFASCKISRVITVEASGIAPALMTGLALRVPVVFAKKSISDEVDPECYATTVFSYTKQINYTIRINQSYLQTEDNILIIDDFLANGRAVLGLAHLVRQAGATLAGVGIVIEKAFQEGGQKLRDLGIRVESLAVIKDMSNGIIFA